MSASTTKDFEFWENKCLIQNKVFRIKIKMNNLESPYECIIMYLKRGGLRVGSSWKMYRIFIYPILFGRIWHNSHSFPSFCQIFWRLLVLWKTPNFVFPKHCVGWFVYSFGSNCTLLPFLFLLPLWYFLRCLLFLKCWVIILLTRSFFDENK